MSRLKKMLHMPRKLAFTRDGKWFVGMSIMVGAGAVNTGNNLLYLLLGMMLWLIIASGVLSERVLRKVSIRELDSGDLFANKPVPARYEITNNKSLFASFSLAVASRESKSTRAMRRRAMGLPEQLPTRKKDRETEDDPGGPSGLALRVPAGEKRVATGTYVYPRRGLYSYDGLDLITRCPFGFFAKTRPFVAPHEVLVYPELRTDVHIARWQDLLDGEVPRATEGRTGDFFGLQEYREGDDIRDVHWKVSARRNQLVRRLYEKDDTEAIAVHLYNWQPESMLDSKDRSLTDEMETLITLAASICADIARTGHRFSLVTIDERVDEGGGAGQLKTCLRHLALLKVRHDKEPPNIERARGGNRIVFVPEAAPKSTERGFERVLRASDFATIAPVTDDAVTVAGSSSSASAKRQGHAAALATSDSGASNRGAA